MEGGGERWSSEYRFNSDSCPFSLVAVDQSWGKLQVLHRRISQAATSRSYLSINASIV
jgi:hypothetical protein